MSEPIPLGFPLQQHPRAILVGASSGIGAATAKKLAKEGYIVALLGRRRKELNAIVKEINNQFGETRAVAYTHDVTKFSTVPTTFQKILADLKQLDLVMYVAGHLNTVLIDEYDFAKEHEMLEINLAGAMAWLGQAAIYFERMGLGQIAAVSSVAGDRGRVGNPAYNASKAGLSTYLEALRNRLTRKGVNVLTIKAGFVQTRLLKTSKVFGVISPEEAADKIWAGLKRKKQTIYVPSWWKFLMLTIQHVPSFIFRRLSF